MGQHFCRITIVVLGINFERFQHFDLDAVVNRLTQQYRLTITRREESGYLNIMERVYWTNNLWKLKRLARAIKRLIPEANVLVGTQRLLLPGPTTTGEAALHGS